MPIYRGERDRVQDSSGTEGDSSQVSRGSVVFLHATTGKLSYLCRLGLQFIVPGAMREIGLITVFDWFRLLFRVCSG